MSTSELPATARERLLLAAAGRRVYAKTAPPEDATVLETQATTYEWAALILTNDTALALVLPTWHSLQAPSSAVAAPNREELGRRVREVWIDWARRQPNPKQSWLVPWEELSEPDKEADRLIGEALARPDPVLWHTALVQGDRVAVGGDGTLWDEITPDDFRVRHGTNAPAGDSLTLAGISRHHGLRWVVPAATPLPEQP